jgi:hypothetical protein
LPRGWVASGVSGVSGTGGAVDDLAALSVRRSVASRASGVALE